MLTLQPQNYFTLVRQISNHLDAATYYVQAVIRNAYTDATIATLQLTDKGGQRFKYDWMVPADPSGQGFYISVVTSVYTDSGYTTKSPNYGDDENTYLIQDRILVGRVGGMGGPDTFEIRNMIAAEMATFFEKYKALEASTKDDMTETEQAEPMRWEEVLTALSAIQGIVSEDKSVDFSGVMSKMDEISVAVRDKEVTPETNLSPILDLIDRYEIDRINDIAEIQDTISGLEDDIVKKTSEFFGSVLEKKQFKTELVTRVVLEDPKQETQKPVDLNELSK